MALVSGGRSTLNPNAPLFIPAAFRQVEDFSPEWWQLITTSPWYHNYWLSEHQDGEAFSGNADNDIDNIVDLLPETFDLDAGDEFSNMEAQFEEFIKFSEMEGDKSYPLPMLNNGMIQNSENYQFPTASLNIFLGDIILPFIHLDSRHGDGG